MKGQVQVAYGGALVQSAGDHDPACDGLRNEEDAHHKIDAKFLKGNRLFEEEVKHGECIEQPCKACNVAMDPFHVENEFVFGQGHAGVDEFIFGCFLILGEFLFPGLLTAGRHGAADRIPLHDGKARAGEAYKSPEYDEKSHDEGRIWSVNEPGKVMR